MVPKIHIVRTVDGTDFPLPSYTSKHHVGLNLMAAVSAPLKINPRERIHVPVGFAVAIPDGLCGQIVSDRNMALTHGIVVLDAPSIVHPADRKPLFVLLRNESNLQFILRRGMVIAQMLLVPVVQTAWQEVKTNVKVEHKAQLSDILVEDGDQSDSSQYLKPSSKRPKVSIRERSSGHGE